MKISKENAIHYIWGDNCEGYRLVSRDHLSVIHEIMPAHTQEKRHYHSLSTQFFYILNGQARFELNNEIFILNEYEGIEVKPLLPHHIKNESDQSIEFMVISSPKTQGDRTDL